MVYIYKGFSRSHLDYSDIIYDIFCQKIESVQYNAALAITRTIRGTSREKLYQDLSTDRTLCFFYKIKNNVTASKIYFHQQDNLLII